MELHDRAKAEGKEMDWGIVSERSWWERAPRVLPAEGEEEEKEKSDKRKEQKEEGKESSDTGDKETKEPEQESEAFEDEVQTNGTVTSIGDEKQEDDNEEGQEGVYVHVKLNRWDEEAFGEDLDEEQSGPRKQSKRPTHSLVMNILRALHRFREDPYRADWVVNDSEGYEWARGCVGGKNGACY